MEGGKQIGREGREGVRKNPFRRGLKVASWERGWLMLLTVGYVTPYVTPCVSRGLQNVEFCKPRLHRVLHRGYMPNP